MECSRQSAKTYQNSTIWLLSIKTYRTGLTQLIPLRTTGNTQSGFRHATAYSSNGRGGREKMLVKMLWTSSLGCAPFLCTSYSHSTKMTTFRDDCQRLCTRNPKSAGKACSD
ncbi:uncharacterized protein UBRO_21078 [Ustilago bromivora]|uniref:Uncharacterized protein n=1 Tax=Ustilago bromivora TaxID=307758 RepID=A0A1K0HGV2_9BASI|nr:uncharacterized protein UBRO_21078 [Ustilago bromivora]